MTCGYPKGNCRHKDLNFGSLEKAERCELVTGVTEQAVCGTWERGKVGSRVPVVGRLFLSLLSLPAAATFRIAW